MYASASPQKCLDVAGAVVGHPSLAGLLLSEFAEALRILSSRESDNRLQSFVPLPQPPCRAIEYLLPFQSSCRLWGLAPQAQARFSCIAHSYSDFNLEDLMKKWQMMNYNCHWLNNLWIPFVKEAYVLWPFAFSCFGGGVRWLGWILKCCCPPPRFLCPHRLPGAVGCSCPGSTAINSVA